MTEARTLSEEALRHYLSDPAEARRQARHAKSLAVAERDWITASMSDRVLGLVAGHLSDSQAARRHLSTAIRLGLRGGDPASAARARSDLAYVLVRQGRSQAALREIEQARPHLPAEEFGGLLMMQALVFKALGRWDDALRSYGQAFPLVRRGGDRQALAVLLGNRGVLQLYRGRLQAAERDLTEADELLKSLGHDLHRAITLHNLGYVCALRGEVPLALARYDEAERGYARHREVPQELWRDRCELLLAAGLGAEARAAADRAVAAATARHERAELAEAQLRLAQAALVDEDSRTAQLVASQAARAFLRQRRPGWAALARWTAVLACLAAGEDVSDIELRRAAVRLERAGWGSAALEARLRAADGALKRGATAIAVRDLEQVRRSRMIGPVWGRELGWHAEALLRQLHGDRTGALRAAGSGLALLDEHRASLGATDLRAAASRRFSALAKLGLGLALSGGRPTTVLRWAERTRAAALIRPAAHPPDGSALKEDLGELRRVVSQRWTAVESGKPDRELLRQQVTLERTIRRRTHRVAGERGSLPSTLARPAELAEALGSAALVEYASCDGQLYAVTLASGRLRLSELGPVAAVKRELEFASYALRRLAASGEDRTSGTRETLETATSRLDDVLLHPLRGVIGDRSLVIVPTEPLHVAPWSVLPSCHGRPVSVSPSATIWHAAARRPGYGSAAAARPVLVAGPRLRHANSEITALARLHESAAVLTERQATVVAVLAAMEGASLVHIAAHGTFRRDNPQFSAIELTDGPLTVYDIEGLRSSPHQVVLSSCETARSAVLNGDELLGFASALLTLGVRSLVAPMVPVPDAEAEPLMLELHAGLRAGRSMAEALAAATDGGRKRSERHLAAAAAFVCWGA